MLIWAEIVDDLLFMGTVDKNTILECIRFIFTIVSPVFIFLLIYCEDLVAELDSTEVKFLVFFIKSKGHDETN